MGKITNWQSNPYAEVLRVRPFAVFWAGFTLSALGDGMTRVALVWFVLVTTHSPQAVGILLLCYTGPVLVGGLVAGALLDRFDRAHVMVVDNVVRGLAVAMVPLLQALGVLELWQLYVVAGIYGFFYMVTLAGTPTLIPSLVRDEYLPAANALETLSYTISGVLGPPVAGLLIALVGAPNVLLLDAFSYAIFVVALLGITQRALVTSAHDATPSDRATSQPAYRLRDAVRLLLTNRVLLSTTLMYTCFNAGTGFVAVWLPVLMAHVPDGGAALYGILLGMLAFGETLGAALGGSVPRSARLGRLICLAQTLSGVSLLLVLVGGSLGLPVLGAGAGLLLLGVCSAPLTIWAQTLRMRIIPPGLRGRTFVLLRTLIQGAGPLASAAAGVLPPPLGVSSLIAASAVLVGAPGLVGSQVEELRHASPISVSASELA
jgi:MFS family permease